MNKSGNSVASIQRVKYRFYKLPNGKAVPLKKNEMKKVSKMMDKLDDLDEAGLSKTKKFRDLFTKASMIFQRGMRRLKSTCPNAKSVNVNPQLQIGNNPPRSLMRQPALLVRDLA
jgi:hypothetical protein